MTVDKRKNKTLTAFQDILAYCSLLDQYFTSSKVRAVFPHISSRNWVDILIIIGSIVERDKI